MWHAHAHARLGQSLNYRALRRSFALPGSVRVPPVRMKCHCYIHTYTEVNLYILVLQAEVWTAGLIGVGVIGIIYEAAWPMGGCGVGVSSP